jgi:hypothetical protein
MELLGTVAVSEARETDGVQVFGLRWPEDGSRPYRTLDEALASGLFEVQETSQAGSVPALRVSNKGAAEVLLVAGEELVGAKQNRVLDVSMLVAAGSEIPIPVSCVERGRWSYSSPRFASGGSAAHASLRSLMSKAVGQSYRRTGRPSADQRAVWTEVSQKLASLGSASSSDALHQAYEDSSRRLDDFLAKLPAPEGSSGAAFAIQGHIVGADLFDRPATLAALWPKLLRGYALDSMGRHQDAAPPVGSHDVREWLRSAARAQAQPFKSPGVGEDVRFEAEGLVGSALVVDGHPLHVELFADARREPAATPV